MADKFWEEVGRHLFDWSGWVFTVGGAVVALWLAREYWWISVLIVLTVGLALGTLTLRKHRELQQARQGHTEEMERLRDEHKATLEKLTECERQLSEVPREVLARLESAFAASSSAALAQALSAHAAFVARMRSFIRASTKPIDVRTFNRSADDLYVMTKVEAEALDHLRIGDPFLLVKRAASGVEIPSARLVVHQQPDPAKRVVIFQVQSYFSEELGHLARLAESGDVQGIKGYAVRLAYDVEGYGDFDFQGLPPVLSRLIQDILPGPRG